MRWGKVVLLFQAIVTLIIGLVFLSQVIAINDFKPSEFNANSVNLPQKDTSEIINDIKQRYTAAAYILLVVSIMEIVIISRLIS